MTEDHKYRKKPIESIYIMGDFNIDDKNSLIDPLYHSKYKFVSARHVTNSDDATVGTFHDFQGAKYDKITIIDHILFSSKKTVTRFNVLRNEPLHLSDHYPVVAEFFKD
jgi:endonuclease/exonuclease/phosphatase family metal-dependent hydrolase